MVVGGLWEETVRLLLAVERGWLSVSEEDQTRPLVEIVSADEVRPVTPPVTITKLLRFSVIWTGLMLVGGEDHWETGLKYWVYFETTGDEIAYPVSQFS
ncbi:hypothetical protein Godav_015951 [Gossypium davidsonii]|uniref:Uncharacterized protein n=1 Tax=Gossypium davidsonii TaxID=34287 RepID=A0A7J8RQH1_GOSDV|nr:hypothetical protein [Gossypium davidsonii]